MVKGSGALSWGSSEEDVATVAPLNSFGGKAIEAGSIGLATAVGKRQHFHLRRNRGVHWKLRRVRYVDCGYTVGGPRARMSRRKGASHTRRIDTNAHPHHPDLASHVAHGHGDEQQNHESLGDTFLGWA